MNANAFKSQVARAVAANIGITRRQASSIIGHVAHLSGAHANAITVHVRKLGPVALSNRMVPVAGQARTFKTSEAVAKFKVGDTLKTVTIRGFEAARPVASISYALANRNAIRVSCALEGDHDTTPPRDPQKKG